MTLEKLELRFLSFSRYFSKEKIKNSNSLIQLNNFITFLIYSIQSIILLIQCSSLKIIIGHDLYKKNRNYNHMNLNFHQKKKKKKFLHPSITLPSARYQIRVKVSKGIQLDKEHGSKRRKSGRSWSGHRGGRSNTRVFVVGPPSLWLRQHVSVPGSESFRPATRYFKWSLGRSVVIALR